jgi:hypothetical protein
MSPARRVIKEKLIPWRVPEAIAEQIKYWFNKGAEAEYLSADWYEATEAIKSLPGYPLAYNPTEGEILVLETIDKIASTDV